MTMKVKIDLMNLFKIIRISQTGIFSSVTKTKDSIMNLLYSKKKLIRKVVRFKRSTTK